jgi:hypothetical protein
MSFYGDHLSCNIFFMACFSFLYTGITLFTIQQTVFLVCRRTDNYFVTLFIPVHVIFFATRIRDLLVVICCKLNDIELVDVIASLTVPLSQADYS